MGWPRPWPSAGAWENLLDFAFEFRFASGLGSGPIPGFLGLFDVAPFWRVVFLGVGRGPACVCGAIAKEEDG